jgi:DNA-binding beta-propeller fold protein YncE
MRFFSRLSRSRRIILGVGVALLLGGIGLAVFAPRPVNIPIAANGAEDAPRLAYVRSLPDAGDAAFVRPVGLAVYSRRLYVSDSGAGVVRAFTTSGTDEGEIGRGVLKVPAYLAADEATGTLLVADRELRTVLRFARDGEPLGELRPSTETTAPWEPLGVAVDGKGTVAVTDSAGRHRLFVTDRNGTVRFSLGGGLSVGAAGEVNVSLDFPNSVAFSKDEIWVSDSNNRRVLIFGRDGEFKRFVKIDGITRGLSLLADAAGTVRYVAVVDTLASDIILLDSEGAEVTRYGSPGSKAGELAYPNDVVYDAASKQLFVADTGNARVQVWKVTWPGDRSTPEVIAERLRLSPMALFGLLVALVGAVAGGVALLPRRR